MKRIYIKRILMFYSDSQLYAFFFDFFHDWQIFLFLNFIYVWTTDILLFVERKLRDN